MRNTVVIKQTLLKLSTKNRYLVSDKWINRRFRELLINANDYNCWAFVSLIFKWIKEMCWLEDDDIEYYLAKHTTRIPENKVKIGDIAVYRDSCDGEYHGSEGIIEHTAIVSRINKSTGEIFVIHKPGMCDIEIMEAEKVMDHYMGYGDTLIYHRALKAFTKKKGK